MASGSAPLDQEPQDIDRVVRRATLAFNLDSVRGYVVKQGLAVGERRVRSHEGGLCIEQPLQRVELARVDGIGGGFESWVNFVVSVSERVGQVPIPVVLGDRESSRLEVERSSRRVRRFLNEPGEAQDFGRGRLTAAGCVAQ